MSELTPDAFAKRFSQRREETLPSWADRERFDHYYRLTTNIRCIDLGDGVIQVGDSVEVLNDNEEEIRFIEDASAYASPDLGINISGLESGE